MFRVNVPESLELSPSRGKPGCLRGRQRGGNSCLSSLVNNQAGLTPAWARKGKWLIQCQRGRALEKDGLIKSHSRFEEERLPQRTLFRLWGLRRCEWEHKGREIWWQGFLSEDLGGRLARFNPRSWCHLGGTTGQRLEGEREARWERIFNVVADRRVC